MIELNFKDYIESKYKYIGEFHEGLACVQNEQDLWGYIDKNGREVIPCQFSGAINFSEGLAATKLSSGWGYIDVSGKTIIPHKLYVAYSFSEGLAAVKSGRMTCWNYVDKNYATQVMSWYNGKFHDGYLVTKDKNHKYEFLDRQGDSNSGFDFATNFDEGIAIIREDKKFITVNTDLEVQKTFSDCNINPVNNNFSCGMLMVKNENDEIGYLNRDLKLQIPTMYYSGSDFKDDMAIVQFDENTISIIDKNGKNITFSKKHQYSKINSFSEGMAAVRSAKTGLWGYINKAGKEVISCQFELADDFSEGLAGVLDIDENLLYIDKRGTKKLKIPKNYKSVLSLDDKTIYITADSEEELNNKKLQVLHLVKEEYIKNLLDEINDVSSDIISELCELHQSKIKKQQKN